MSAAICKKKKYNHHDSTIRMLIIVPWLQYRAETLTYRRGNQDTNTLGLSKVWIEFQDRFQKKKDEVWTVKSQTEQNTLENHIARYTQTRLRSEMHWKNALLSRFSLLFWSYWPKLLLCFFGKVLLLSIFLARIISWRPKRAKKSVSWSVVATSLLGNLEYQIKRKKDLWQKQNCSGAASLQWHHAAELNWDAVMTVARRMRIPNQ